MNKTENKILEGVAWQSLGRYSALIVQFIVTIIIARILTPEDYGVIGLLTVFTSISTMFLDSGLGQSLIQKADPTNEDYSTVFNFNLILSFVFYFTLFLLLPTIASFFRDIRLVEYGRFLFLIIPINSICIVQNTMLLKEFRFKELSIIQVLSALISGVLGVASAYKGYGIWALVIHSIALNLSRATFLIIFNKWIPKIVFSIKSMRELLPFGLSLLSTNLVKVLFQNIYTLIIGRTFSTNEVGYYNQANRFQELSGNTIIDIIVNVSFPVLVQIRDDRKQLKKEYQKIMQTIVFLMVLVMSLMVIVSDDLLVLTLTEKWLPAAPYLRILCFYGMTLPLHLINVNILKVFGEGKKIFHLELIRRFLIIISIILTINISISALLIGQIAAMIPLIIISMHISGKFIDYSIVEQLKDVIGFYFIGVLALFFNIFIFGLFDWNTSTFIILVIKSTLHLIIYLGIVFITRPSFIKKIISNIKQYIHG